LHKRRSWYIVLTREPVSPYSWFGFTNIIKYRYLLNKYGVSIEIIPFFLGGAREGVGNKFEQTPKWKEAFAAQDSELTGELLGLKVVRPKIWPILSLFVSYPSACRSMSKFLMME